MSVTRRDCLKTVGAGLASLVLPANKTIPAAQNREKIHPPNVVIFLTDDQGTLDVNCYGARDLHTPHMDALAARGVRFTQAYAHTVCCPSRALLMTGRQPQRSGVKTWVQGDAREKAGINMNLGEITLAEALKGAGYRTALFGKWHLGAAFGFGPTDQGFDEFFGLRDGFIDNYNHFFLHGRGYHDLYRGDEEDFEPGAYFPQLVVREAVRFLEANRDRPFFMYVGFNLPHYPEQAEKTYDALYERLPEPRRSYAKVVSTVDGHIGQIMRKLDDLKLSQNTIIAFASDNGHSSESAKISVKDHSSGLAEGFNYGANGGGGYTGKWRGAKGSFFEGGIRVPAMMIFPARIPAQAVRDQAVTTADFYPTILELCGVTMPDRKLDGLSLLPILQSPDAPSRHSALHWQWEDTIGDASWAVREGDWKLIFHGVDTTDSWQGHPEPRRKIPETFLGNLTDEQPEYKNHAEERPQIVRHLMRLHEEWVKEIGK
jgi:arylsulfatase A